MAAVALVGRGAHGADIQAIWKAVHGSRRLDPYDDNWGEPPPKYVPIEAFYVGINRSEDRRAVSERLKAWNWTPADPLVHPSAQIGPACGLGLGSVVSANVVLLRDVRVGEGTHINYNVGATRAIIGKYVTISPGATICGDVRIGDGTMIGAGATVCNLVNIGRDVTVGAGAVVLDDVEDGDTVVGVPARALATV